MSESSSSDDIPEMVKLGRWIVRHVHQETDMVRKAPLALFIVFVMGLVAAYWGVSSHYSELVTTLEARDKYHTDQLEDYKKAFPGKSPDEAAKQIGDLRQEVEKLQSRVTDILKKVPPRHLSAKERTDLKGAFISIKGDIPSPFYVFAVTAPGGEPYRYAKEFTDIFGELNISVPEVMTGIISIEGGSGVMIGVSDPANPSAKATKFKQALDSSGIAATLTKSDMMTGTENYDLFIGPISP